MFSTPEISGVQNTYTWGIRVRRNEPLATPNYTPGHWGEAVHAGTAMGRMQHAVSRFGFLSDMLTMCFLSFDRWSRVGTEYGVYYCGAKRSNYVLV